MALFCILLIVKWIIWLPSLDAFRIFASQMPPGMFGLAVPIWLGWERGYESSHLRPREYSR